MDSAQAMPSERFLPEGITDEHVTDKMLNDAISRIAEINVFRLRKKGDFGINLERQLISRHYMAMLRIGEHSGSIPDLIELARDTFGIVSAQALEIRKAEREGRFDPARVQDFLDRLQWAGRRLRGLIPNY
jgi:hypothetical protein